MQSFLLKRFTTPVKITLRGSKAKKSHLSNFPFSFCLNLYQSTILHLVKTLYDVPVGFVPLPLYLEAEYCLFCGHRRVAVARYRMICLVLVKTFCIKIFKKSIKIATKACYNEQIISLDLKPEVDASLNITLRKMMITYGITKSYQLNFFDSLVLQLQDTETESLKTNYIHVYKVFGYKF